MAIDKKFFVILKNKRAEELWAPTFDEAVKKALAEYPEGFDSLVDESFPIESEFLNKVNEMFANTSISQERKGIMEYGQPLDPMDDNYDWNEMAETELVDGYKYLMAARTKRNEVIRLACEKIDVVIAMNFENKPLEKELNEVKKLLKKLNKNI